MKFHPENSITNHAEAEGIVNKIAFLRSHWYNPVTQLGHIRSTRWKVRQQFEKTTKYIPLEIIFFLLGIFWVILLANFGRFFTIAIRDGLSDWRIYGVPQFSGGFSGGDLLFYQTTLLFPFMIFPIFFSTFSFGPLIGIIIARIPMQIKALANSSEPDILLTTTINDREIYNGLLFAPFLTFHRLFTSVLILLGTIIIGVLALALLRFIPTSGSMAFTLGIFGGPAGYVPDYVMLAGIGFMCGLLLAQVSGLTAMKLSVPAASATALICVPVWLLLTRQIAVEIVKLAVPMFRDPFFNIASFYSGLPILEYIFLWFLLMALSVWALERIGPWVFSRVRRNL